MEDPVLTHVYQPAVRATGVDPMAAAKVAMDAFVPFRLFTAWLEWQARPNLLWLAFTLAFVYLARVRIWPIARQGVRIMSSPFAYPFMLIRVTLVACVLAQVLGIAWPLMFGMKARLGTMAAMNILSYVLLLSAVYLPLCDTPPPRKHGGRRLASA